MKQLFKETVADAEINNNKYTVNIKVFTDYDDGFSVDDIDFDSDEDKAKFIRKVERGDIMPAIVWVTASLNGFTGEDNLGAVLIENPENVDDTVREYSMVENAISDLVKTMESDYNKLKEIFE